VGRLRTSHFCHFAIWWAVCGHHISATMPAIALGSRLTGSFLEGHGGSLEKAFTVLFLAGLGLARGVPFPSWWWSSRGDGGREGNGRPLPLFDVPRLVLAS